MSTECLADARRTAVPGGVGSAIASSIDSYKYLGLEHRFRGAQEDIARG